MIPTSEAIAKAAARLKAAGIDEPRREARLVIAAALQIDAGALLARTEVDDAIIETVLRRREAHEPLAYITGRKEFWSLGFAVSPATLIPRPDSETLVDAALANRAAVHRVLDLGTGTGCLLLAVLSEYPGAWGIGVDVVPEAAAIARQNAQSLGLSDRSAFIAGSWADALNTQFDLVLVNPPYIPEADIAGLMPDVALYEPLSALAGGPDGLTAYRVLIQRLPSLLTQSGLAVLELGAGQAEAVSDLAAKQGFRCLIWPDLQGIGRAALLQR